MKKGKTAVAVIIMIIAGIIGTIYDDSMDGAIFFSLIAGIACVIKYRKNRNTSHSEFHVCVRCFPK